MTSSDRWWYIRIGTCALIGWTLSPKLVIDEVEKNGCTFGRKQLYIITIRIIAPILLTVLLLTGLTGCARRGDTSGVEIVSGTSERFSDEDIRGAMDAAMRAFHRGHSGCAMVRLTYNEAYQTCWLAGAGAEDDGSTIVLLASVYARDPGRRSGLTAGETYTDWPFVLERRGSGWRVVSSGY